MTTPSAILGALAALDKAVVGLRRIAATGKRKYEAPDTEELWVALRVIADDIQRNTNIIARSAERTR